MWTGDGMKDATTFERLFIGAGEAAGPGDGTVPPMESRELTPRASSGLMDAVLGLAVRFVLIVQVWSWSRANAAAVEDPLSWRSWVTPTDGLENAARLWTMGQVDAGLAAVLLLAVASLVSLSLAVGVLTRLTGLAVMLGAGWHIMFILPEAFTSTVAYLALGLYLAARGAGPLSLDWALARLARLA